MANTGIVQGGDIQLFRNTGTEQTPVWAAFAHATSHSYKGSTAMLDIVTKDTGRNKKKKAGMNEAPTISAAGFVTYDGTDFFALEALRVAGTKLQVKYSGKPTGDTTIVDTVEATGDKFFTGYAYISECGREDPAEGLATYSITLQFETQPTISTK